VAPSTALNDHMIVTAPTRTDCALLEKPPPFRNVPKTSLAVTFTGAKYTKTRRNAKKPRMWRINTRASRLGKTRLRTVVNKTEIATTA
jgi:hypothetical protein